MVDTEVLKGCVHNLGTNHQIFTAHKRSCGKGMFYTCLSVPGEGIAFPQCHGVDTVSPLYHTLRIIPPNTISTPSPCLGYMGPGILWNTVNKQAVCILLKYFLVYLYFSKNAHRIKKNWYLRGTWSWGSHDQSLKNATSILLWQSLIFNLYWHRVHIGKLLKSLQA